MRLVIHSVKTGLLVTGLSVILLAAPVGAEEQNFKFTSLSSSWDLKTNTMTYQGNAKFVDSLNALSGEKIAATRTAEGKVRSLKVAGSPATLTQAPNPGGFGETRVDAMNIDYQAALNQITAERQVHLWHKDALKRELDVSGSQLEILQKAGYHLSMQGEPLKIIIQQPEQAPIEASAQRLEYDQDKQELQLLGNVVLGRQQETMRAEKVVYNLGTGILNMPEAPNKRIEIIQTKKKKQ